MSDALDGLVDVYADGPGAVTHAVLAEHKDN